MKRAFILFYAAVMILGLTAQAHATLTVLGTGTINHQMGVVMGLVLAAPIS